MSTSHVLPIGIIALAGLVNADTWCGSGTGAIPDDGQTTRTWTAQVDVPGDHLVLTTRLFLQVEHPWVGDLVITLSSPDGTTVTLLDRPGMPDGGWIGPWGCGGDDLSVYFDDSAEEAAENTCSQDAVPVISGSKQPFQPLSELHGRAAPGTWTIEVLDASPIDAGTITTACVNLETSPDCNANGVPDASDIADGTSADADGDGVPDECQCPADLDGSGEVTVDDILVLIAAWGTSGPVGDIDGDGDVDAEDLLAVLAAWGPCT